MSNHLFELTTSQVSNNRWTDRTSAMQAPNHVRCYRYSPDRVALQVRYAKGYSTALLPLEVALALSEALKAEVNQ